ncbi:MAG: DUF4765 family protein [Vibrionaceae bacterium]
MYINKDRVSFNDYCAINAEINAKVSEVHALKEKKKELLLKKAELIQNQHRKKSVQGNKLALLKQQIMQLDKRLEHLKKVELPHLYALDSALLNKAKVIDESEFIPHGFLGKAILNISSCILLPFVKIGQLVDRYPAQSCMLLAATYLGTSAFAAPLHSISEAKSIPHKPKPLKTAAEPDASEAKEHYHHSFNETKEWCEEHPEHQQGCLVRMHKLASNDTAEAKTFIYEQLAEQIAPVLEEINELMDGWQNVQQQLDDFIADPTQIVGDGVFDYELAKNLCEQMKDEAECAKAMLGAISGADESAAIAYLKANFQNLQGGVDQQILALNGIAEDLVSYQQHASKNREKRSTQEHEEDCSQHSPNTFHGLQAHSRCALKKVGHHVEDLKRGPQAKEVFSGEVLSELKTLIPALKFGDTIVKFASSIGNHTEHGQSLLKHVLGFEGKEEAHKEADGVCGLTHILNPAEMANDMLDELLTDISHLVNDRYLTEPMSKLFRKSFLDHYRTNFPKNGWEGFKQGFIANWKGGPIEGALLVTAIDDIANGRTESSLTPSQVHGLMLGSTLWRDVLAFIFPEKGGLDSVFALGKAILESRAHFCDYVQTAANVALAFHASEGAAGENVGSKMRINSVKSIRSNALRYQSKHGEKIYSAIKKSESKFKNSLVEIKEDAQHIASNQIKRKASPAELSNEGLPILEIAEEQSIPCGKGGSCILEREATDTLEYDFTKTAADMVLMEGSGGFTIKELKNGATVTLLRDLEQGEYTSRVTFYFSDENMRAGKFSSDSSSLLIDLIAEMEVSDKAIFHLGETALTERILAMESHGHTPFIDLMRNSVITSEVVKGGDITIYSDGHYSVSSKTRVAQESYMAEKIELAEKKVKLRCRRGDEACISGKMEKLGLGGTSARESKAEVFRNQLRRTVRPQGKPAWNRAQPPQSRFTSSRRMTSYGKERGFDAYDLVHETARKEAIRKAAQREAARTQRIAEQQKAANKAHRDLLARVRYEESHPDKSGLSAIIYYKDGKPVHLEAGAPLTAKERMARIRFKNQKAQNEKLLNNQREFDVIANRRPLLQSRAEGQNKADHSKNYPSNRHGANKDYKKHAHPVQLEKGSRLPVLKQT